MAYVEVGSTKYCNRTLLSGVCYAALKKPMRESMKASYSWRALLQDRQPTLSCSCCGCLFNSVCLELGGVAQ